MSSIQIDAFSFDTHTGTVQKTHRRLAVYAPSTINGIGVQLLPRFGPTFRMATTRYMADGDQRLFSDQLDALEGDFVKIVEGSVDYLAAYGLRYLVERVEHTLIDTFVRANGSRNGVAVSYSPAGVVRTAWQFRAVVE